MGFILASVFGIVAAALLFAVFDHAVKRWAWRSATREALHEMRERHGVEPDGDGGWRCTKRD